MRVKMLRPPGSRKLEKGDRVTIKKKDPKVVIIVVQEISAVEVMGNTEQYVDAILEVNYL